MGAQTRRFLGHHLLHPLILRLRALFYRTDCTRRCKFLTHALYKYKVVSPPNFWTFRHLCGTRLVGTKSLLLPYLVSRYVRMFRLSIDFSLLSTSFMTSLFVGSTCKQISKFPVIHIENKTKKAFSLIGYAMNEKTKA